MNFAYFFGGLIMSSYFFLAVIHLFVSILVMFKVIQPIMWRYKIIAAVVIGAIVCMDML